jgi:hypothetical protein
VISVGPAYASLTPFGQRYSVMTIVAERGGQDFVGHDVILVGAESDPTLAAVYRMALVIALEEFFACVQIFGTELALAKYWQKKWPGSWRKPAGSRCQRSSSVLSPNTWRMPDFIRRA